MHISKNIDGLFDITLNNGHLLKLDAEMAPRFLAYIELLLDDGGRQKWFSGGTNFWLAPSRSQQRPLAYYQLNELDPSTGWWQSGYLTRLELVNLARLLNNL